MSAPGHASDSDVHEAHDHYEGIAAVHAAPDEPESPAWLPLLGLGLLLTGVLGYVITRPAGKTAAELAAAAEPTAPATASAEPTPPAPEAARQPNTPPRQPRVMPMGSAAPGALPRLPRPGASVVQPGRPPGVFTMPGGNRPAPGGAADPHAGHNHP
jgi:hypothetical protein